MPLLTSVRGRGEAAEGACVTSWEVTRSGVSGVVRVVTRGKRGVTMEAFWMSRVDNLEEYGRWPILA